jgi:hypothetical protein
MAIFVVILFLFLLLTLGAGGLLFVVSRQRAAKSARVANAQQPPTASGLKLGFRRRYVILPNLILGVSLIAVLYFFRLLPGHVGYQFAVDGSAERFVGRGALVAAMLAPQFLLAFLAAAIAHVVAKVGGRFIRDGATPVSVVESVITVMSNMVVLPQTVLFFAMVDIFSYNAFRFHVVEPWIVALVVMLLGGPILAIFFFRAMQQARPAR